MDLNTILIILGILALIGLVGHGIWSNRREKSLYFKQKNTHSAPNFSEPASQTPSQAIPKVHTQPSLTVPVEPAPIEPSHSEQHLQTIRITLPEDPTPEVSQIEPEPIPEPEDSPVIYTYTPETHSSHNATPQSQTQSAQDIYHYKDTASDTQHIQVSEDENTMVSPISQPKPIEPIQTTTAEPQPQKQQATSYVMLYVVAAENQQFQGTTLSTVLEDLGFIFGRDNLYHRHLDLTIASPVIFSLANATQPGTFDPYAMRRFSTPGVVLYMQVPSVGNDRTNLKIMIQAARNLAEQLGGFVLTDDEQLFDETAEQQYLARL